MHMTISIFDVIIGMDWLSPHRAGILSHDKEIWLPLPNGESLVIYGDKTTKGLRVICYMKAHKYVHKKYHTFLDHNVDKEGKKKEIKDIPQICDFPDVFLEALTELPPIRDVEFWIDLVLGVALVAKSPCLLAL